MSDDIKMTRTGRFPRNARLQHHAGSVWEVIRHVPSGNYRIRCIVGTVRAEWIGGEVEGSIRQVHADYLHDSTGWTLLP